MLKTLYIHNYAIIDEVVIDFSPRLNVITGETGAGKSILMGALSLILGDRADTSVLQNREKKCIVEGSFRVDGNKRLNEILASNELGQGDDDEILIRREIGVSGKSRAFINDTPVNLDLLKQVSALLVDLHRQFDTLSLSDSGFQRDVLDALGNNAALAQQYREVFLSWQQTSGSLRALAEQKAASEKEYDYHQFLFDELEEAAFSPNELEEADAELKLLSNAASIKAALSGAAEMLSGAEQPVVQQLKSVQHQLDPFTRYHPALEEIINRLRSAHIELQDVAEEVESINEAVRYDPARIDILNERVALGYKLLKKHGVKTTAGLLEIRGVLEKKLEEVVNIDALMARLQQESDALWKGVETRAEKLKEKRRQQVRPLEEKVNRLLGQVGMPNAKLKVTIEDKPADEWGTDNVEFLFDANKSGRFEPIRKVASGGELSRLMLSIKSLVAESMDLPTLIFDEIDTGISGEAARQVGIIMSGLADKRQLITITHQPQIAGRAHTHLFVYKDNRSGAVRTGIRVLAGEERIVAIAKMLSGEKPTAAALENAREMVVN